MHGETVAQAAQNAFHVMLTYGPVGLVRATARELGLDGIVVDTGAVALEPNDEVEVTLSCRAEGELARVYRLAARVVATSTDEVKLVFDKADQELYRLLRGLMTVH